MSATTHPLGTDAEIPEPGWIDALDQFEENLDGYASRLEDLDDLPGTTEPVIPPFEAPDDLGPFPRSLEPRARRLLFRAAQLEVQLRSDLELARADLPTRSNAPRAFSASEPAILDRTA